MAQRMEPAYNKLHTSSDVRKNMEKYYIKSKLISKVPINRKKIAWFTSGAPVEIAVAGGVFPLYPENYTAASGAAKTAVKSSEFAEQEGFSTELCSYARCHLGSVFQPEESLMGGLSKPDFLVCSNNICGTVKNWFQILSEYYNIPMFLFDTPPTTGKSQEEHVFHYVRGQVDEYIEFIENQTGKKIQEKNLLKTLSYATQSDKIWTEILNLCKNTPSPLNCADRFITMAPIVTQRGSKRTIEIYKKIRTEVEYRVANSIGAIKNEKIRLLWDNIAIWFYLFPLFNKLAQKGVVFPADTYTHAWGIGIDSINFKNALDNLAKVYSQIYLNHDLNYRIELITRIIDDFNIDGFILHSNRSCKRYSMGMNSYKNKIIDSTGKPGIIIDGDMVDNRNFSEEQTWTRLEAFIELIESKKN